MFNKKFFSDMKRSGMMNVGLSKAKLSEAMLDILLQLPQGATNLKETIISHMGLIGQMSTTRDLNDAWNQAKKKAAKLYPDEFILDGRKVLHWNDGSVDDLDKKISTANFKKLNALADMENCSVNKLISTLIKSYEKQTPKKKK